MESNVNAVHREPWNKGKSVGQKAPFKVKDIRPRSRTSGHSAFACRWKAA